MLINSENLQKLMYEVLKKCDLSEQDAEVAAEVLIQADLRGIDTHGAIRLPIYVKRLQLGLVSPRPVIKFVRETDTTAIVDGDFGLGHVTSYKAMKIAIEKASRHGLAAVGVRNSHHNGAAAYYAQMALEHDMIGFSCTNSPPLMPAPGGADKVVGNNPFAIAVPAGKELPLVLDMACSLVAQGKVMLAMKKGEPIPQGWATDNKGIPTADAAAGLKGFLLPAGGYKGYCMAIIVDALAGVLTGAAFGKGVTSIYGDLINKQNAGHFFMAIKVSNFMEPDIFKGLIDSYIREIKSTPLTSGTDEVFMPGEKEYRTKATRSAEGINMAAAVVDDLLKMAADVGVNGKAILGI